jgi:hypothetical protein
MSSEARQKACHVVDCRYGRPIMGGSAAERGRQKAAREIDGAGLFPDDGTRELARQ